MPLSNINSHHITNATGTVAIASSSSSMGVAKIAESAPADATLLIQEAHQIITTADAIAIVSVVIMGISFVWKVYTDIKRKDIDERLYDLRKRELELELIKLNVEDNTNAT